MISIRTITLAALATAAGLVLATAPASAQTKPSPGQAYEVPVKCTGPNFSKFSGCAVTVKDGVPISARGSGGSVTFSSCSGGPSKFNCFGVGEMIVDLRAKTIYQ